VLYRRTYRDRKTGKIRKAPAWWYEFQFGGGRIRESSGCTSKTLARQAEQNRRRELEEGGAGGRRRRPKLVRVAAEIYLARKRPTLKKKSLAAEQSNLKHLLPFFGGKLTTDVGVDDVARYQDGRTKEGAAAGTINLELGTLRAVVGPRLWANLKEDGVRMLTEREDAGRAITPEEESRLLRACSESMSRSLYTAVVVDLNTGLRYGELVGLRWMQVDLVRRRLTVGESKTEAGAGRTVPLNDRAFAALSMQASRFPGRRPEHYVFPTERYKKLPSGQGGVAYGLDPKTPVKDVGEAGDAAKRRTADEEKGIPAVVCRWHDLRHTFVTRLLESGQSLAVVGRVVGWSASTLARMSRRYGHLGEETLRRAVCVLDGADFQVGLPPESPTAEVRVEPPPS
jgi:integrase